MSFEDDLERERRISENYQKWAAREAAKGNDEKAQEHLDNWEKSLDRREMLLREAEFNKKPGCRSSAVALLGAVIIGIATVRGWLS